ncbi:hypothetical protein VIGAN_05168100 [Vigna angularis var. angularis]|uniref:Uncharacterized protein n=1 Tax=Vigna angularis var. angularis TaxID=157739 RepID=A0A0S3S5Z0_PHAAN|nr:hypothetical protein VIGAN_05168100 [Vigna angularis var. angularis]
MRRLLQTVGNWWVICPVIHVTTLMEKLPSQSNQIPSFSFDSFLPIYNRSRNSHLHTIKWFYIEVQVCGQGNLIMKWKKLEFSFLNNFFCKHIILS